MDRPDETKVSIKITGFVCPPSEISAALGLEPTKQWLKGDRAHPKAGIVHSSNGWMRHSGLPVEASTEDQIRELVRIVSPLVSRFSTLPKEAAVAIFCVVYSQHGRPDISLSPDLIKALAEIGAGLEFDLYQLSDE